MSMWTFEVHAYGEHETFVARTERAIWTDVFAACRVMGLAQCDDAQYRLYNDTRELSDVLGGESVRPGDVVWEHTGPLALGSARNVYFGRI